MNWPEAFAYASSAFTVASIVCAISWCIVGIAKQGKKQ